MTSASARRKVGASGRPSAIAAPASAASSPAADHASKRAFGNRARIRRRSSPSVGEVVGSTRNRSRAPPSGACSLRDTGELGEEPRRPEVPALPGEAGEAGGVVELERRRLEDGVRAAPARRVRAVPLELRRPPLPARHDDAHRVAVPGDRGRVGGRDRRGDRARLRDVGDDVLARRLAGAEAGERGGRAEDLQEAAAGEPVRRLRGALRELVLRRGGASLALLERAPAPRLEAALLTVDREA